MKAPARKIVILTVTLISFALAASSFAEEKESLLRRMGKAAAAAAKRAGEAVRGIAKIRPSREKTAPSAKARLEQKRKAAKQMPMARKPEKPRKAVKDMKRPELLAQIKDILKEEDSILGLVPELKKEKKALGAETYVYNGVVLDNLDEETLRKLLTKVYTERSRISAERIARQIENIAKIHKIAQPPPRVVAPPKLPPAPPPAAQTPPKAPSPLPPPTRR